MQVAEKMNAAFIPFNLITGQERNQIEGSRHVASTVEMADVTRPVEVNKYVKQIYEINTATTTMTICIEVLCLPK